jgi:hypothetical protein
MAMALALVYLKSRTLYLKAFNNDGKPRFVVNVWRLNNITLAPFDARVRLRELEGAQQDAEYDLWKRELYQSGLRKCDYSTHSSLVARI